jgi:hypothetical protein
MICCGKHRLTEALYIVTIYSDCLRGFGLNIGFIDHFNTKQVFTLKYSVIVNFHILQITIAHRLLFSVCYSLH